MSSFSSNFEQLKLDPSNANLGTPEGKAMLKKSLERLGAGRSVVCDRHGVLIAGNKTYEASQELEMPIKKVVTSGSELIVVVREDLDLGTDSIAQELAIADNRIAEVSLNWSLPVLKELEQEADLSWLFPDGLDLDDENEEEWIKKRNEATASANIDNLDIKPRCKTGEIYQLGRHKVVCGDCRDTDLLEKLLGDRIPDVIWADPPYGIKCQNTSGQIGSKGRKYLEIHDDRSKDTASEAFKLYFGRYYKTPHIWWGANHYSECLPASSTWIVWDKENGETDFADAELAWTNDESAVRIFRWKWNGFLKKGEAANQKRCHPNQKPVELVDWYWNNYAAESTLMLDPFLGSGTSIFSAQKSGDRSVYGFEYLPEYCEVIFQRWETLGQAVEKID